MQLHVYQRTQVYESRMLALAELRGADIGKAEIAIEKEEKTIRNLQKPIWQKTVEVRRPSTFPPWTPIVLP